MPFDARAAKALKPGEFMAVPDCSGLRLLATKTRKTWTYRYRAPNQSLKQVALGAFPAMSLDDARRRWDELREARRQGDDPALKVKAQRQAKEVVAPPEIYTVEKLVQDFITGHIMVSRKEAGADAAKRKLERLLAEEPEFAARAVGAVDRKQCFDVLEARKGTPAATTKLRSMMGSAWDHALDAGKIDGSVPNWWRQIMKGKLKSKGKVMGGKHIGPRRRFLRPEDVGTVVRWLPNMHELGRDGIVMYLWTCTRGAEIFAMRPEHLHKEKGVLWWTIPKSQTKNVNHPLAVDLRVPLFGRALAVVERRLKNVGKSGFLFEDSKGEQYTQHDFSTYIYDHQPYSPKSKRSGDPARVLPVTDWTAHNLRRTSRTMLASLGCSKEVGEAVVGHMPEEIEATYNLHTYDAERLVWLKRLSDHLETLASEPV